MGLKEVERITAEMTKLAQAQGYKDLAAFRDAINNDPKWKPKSEEQIVADFKKYIDQMQPKLPELFGLLPKSPVTVEAIPDFDKAAATHYVRGTAGRQAGRARGGRRRRPDPPHAGDRRGRRLSRRRARAPHADQHRRSSFRACRNSACSAAAYSAYTEGWALYSEELGKEIGFYKDPVSDYGRLNSELFRAVRLVVDTGIHRQGLDARQGDRLTCARTMSTTSLAQTETDRYIAWPAQALAYKMGQLKIRELRERAKTQLGARFDIKAFHDEMLNGGALPLDLLEERVDGWIKEQGAAAPKSGR